MTNISLPIAAAMGLGIFLFAAGTQAQFSVQTERIGTFVGEYPDSPNVPVNRRHMMGTDLGLTARWGQYGIVLFGDSMLSEESPPAANVADLQHDDAWVWFLNQGSSRNAVPSYNVYARTSRVQNRVSNTDLNMAGARTPAGIASFNEAFFWAIFARFGSHQKCSSHAQCQGLTCDSDLRVYTPPTPPGAPLANPRICFAANAACAQATPGQIGVCRDSSATNPMNNFTAPVPYFDSAPGIPYPLSQAQQRKLLTVATIHEFGPNTAQQLSTYSTVPWITNKFTNVTMRTTRDFIDYKMPPLQPTIDNIVWIWGRPSYWTNTSAGAPADVFLAAQYRSKLPKTGSNATKLDLMYRKADGTWSTNQNDAAKLTATDGWADGVAGHMSVSYLEGPKKWLMTYGGGIPVLFDAVGGPLPATLSTAVKTDGTVKFRVADHPWGPWSAPVEALSPFDEDPNDDGNDGICHQLHDGALFGTNDRCGGNNRPPSQFPLLGPGSLYGSSVVESWTTWNSSTKKAEIGWLISTWNPYEVHQMKSVLTFP